MFRYLVFPLICSFGTAVAMDLPIIPRPIQVDPGGGTLSLTGNVRIDAGNAAQAAMLASMVTDALRTAGLHASSSSPAIPVTFEQVPATDGESAEAYKMKVTSQGITIRGDGAGLYYGVSSLAQWIGLTPKASGKIALPCVEIEDSPRFAWRGFMLDESRFFAGEDEVKRLLDTMACYKLNRFHWHLTDSPGWRIEIKSYPKLTEIGARGNEADPFGKGKPEFYTQTQIRRIVSYAKNRHITVIPEIDMPGHADAAVRAYPELDGGGFQQKDGNGKWPRFTYNPASPKVLVFRTKVLAEIAAMFPDSGVIHFGGDEVHFGWGKWQKLPEVQALMTREKLADNAAVERWFGRGMAAEINRLGFKAGGWDEISTMDLAPAQTLVFWWRHDKPEVLQQALVAGYPVVLCPRRPLYFDFIQSAGHKDGRTWKGFNPLKDVYDFPDSLGLSSDLQKGVVGIQACLWTETARTRERREFLTWPRLAAAAESAWTTKTRKNQASFETRLRSHLPLLKARGLTVFDPFTNSPEITDHAGEGSSAYPDSPPSSQR